MLLGESLLRCVIAARRRRHGLMRLDSMLPVETHELAGLLFEAVEIVTRAGDRRFGFLPSLRTLGRGAFGHELGDQDLVLVLLLGSLFQFDGRLVDFLSPILDVDLDVAELFLVVGADLLDAVVVVVLNLLAAGVAVQLDAASLGVESILGLVPGRLVVRLNPGLQRSNDLSRQLDHLRQRLTLEVGVVVVGHRGRAAQIGFEISVHGPGSELSLQSWRAASRALPIRSIAKTADRMFASSGAMYCCSKRRAFSSRQFSLVCCQSANSFLLA